VASPAPASLVSLIAPPEDIEKVDPSWFGFLDDCALSIILYTLSLTHDSLCAHAMLLLIYMLPIILNSRLLLRIANYVWLVQYSFSLSTSPTLLRCHIGSSFSPSCSSCARCGMIMRPDRAALIGHTVPQAAFEVPNQLSELLSVSARSQSATVIWQRALRSLYGEL
jgi:hypothetical protein